MSNPSNHFIKSTILKLLGAIGSKKEINKYIEKFSSPEQRFAVIKVGGSVIENDLENLISSLVFLNQVGLRACHTSWSWSNALCRLGREENRLFFYRWTKGHFFGGERRCLFCFQGH